MASKKANPFTKGKAADKGKGEKPPKAMKGKKGC